MNKRKLNKIITFRYAKEFILYEIYRVRGLTVKQAAKSIFGSYDYAFEFIKNLEKEDLVQGKIYNNGKNKRLGKFITVTEKGIEMLVSHNLLLPVENTNERLESKSTLPFTPIHDSDINETHVYRPKLLPHNVNFQGYDKHKAIFTLLTNELYAEITSYGMYFYDSREWKQRNKLNRNAIVRGGFRALDGKEYSLYIIFSEEQTKRASVSESMLKRIVEEISSTQQKGHHVIYVYDDEQYAWIVQHIRKLKVNSNSVHVIQHSDGRGYEQLRLLSHEDTFKKHLSRLIQTNISEIKRDTLIARYTNYEITVPVSSTENEIFYMFQYLTNNEAALMRMEREFTTGRSSIEQQKMAIIAWEHDRDKLEQLFATTEHIKVRLLPSETMQDLNYTEPLLLADTQQWKNRAAQLNTNERLD